MSEKVDLKKIVIGQYADYFNTGIWTFKDGRLVAPEDLTISQLRDFLVASGGAVYLDPDGRFCWILPSNALQKPVERAEGSAKPPGARKRQKGQVRP